MSESINKKSRWGFKLMTLTYRITDFFKPNPGRKLEIFGISEGDVVLDYGCGPGRYVKKASRLVGQNGLVYAADIHELAIEAVKDKISRYNLENVEPVLINGYDSGLESGSVDLAYALDMFHQVKNHKRMLSELHRVLKSKGVFILEDGHQPRKETVRKVRDSGLWEIADKTDDFLLCQAIDS